MNALSLFNDWLNNEDFGMNGVCTGKYNYNVPDADVTESKDSYTLDMDLPGRNEEDINLELNDTVLTISSVEESETEKKSEEKAGKDEEKPLFLLKERRKTEFRRSFTLPKDIDSENVMASFKNGVLTVKIPRKPESQPKRIAINIA